MIRKLPTLVLVDRMAYVRIRSLYRHLSSLFRNRFFLRLEFHIELGTPMHPGRERMRGKRIDISTRYGITQVSDIPLPNLPTRLSHWHRH
jgi:hypothetical protein